jgi:DNA-binding winged helix-turn-helix (wHTH) protein/tetratricopeptide (TPR) repeat protein
MLYRIGEFQLDTERELLTGRDGAVALRRQTYRLLLLLVERAPALVGRDELMDELWGHHALSPNVIPQTVSELRQALGDDPQQPRYIETRHRRGYAFIAAVDKVIVAADAVESAPVRSLSTPSPTGDAAIDALASDPPQPPSVDRVAGIPSRRSMPRWALPLAIAAAVSVVFVAAGLALRTPPAAPAPASTVPLQSIAATRLAIRLHTDDAALGAYLRLLAHASSDWVVRAGLDQPGTPAALSTWQVVVAADGSWRALDGEGRERSGGQLPATDVPAQALALLQALEAATGRAHLAREPLGWPTALTARRALVDAALATHEERHAAAALAHAQAADAATTPGWPLLFHAEALARTGDWRSALARFAELGASNDQALTLRAEALQKSLSGRPAEALAAQRAYALLMPESIEAGLDVLDAQLAQSQWSAAADSLELLGTALGEQSPRLATRRAEWLAAMQPGQAADAFDWAIGLAAEAGDGDSERRARLGLASWQLQRSRLADAATALQGLESDDPQAGELRGQLAKDQGEIDRARSEFAAAEARWKARGLLGDARRARLGLALVELKAGDAATAEAMARALIAESEQLGDSRLQGDSLEALGMAQISLGQVTEAREHLQAAIDLARSRDDGRREAMARYSLGNAYAHERRVHEAEQAYRLAAEAFRRLHDDRREVLALANLALMAERSGRRAEARELYREALTSVRELGMPRELGRITFNLGIAERDLGDLDAAAAHFDESAAALDLAGASDIRAQVGATRADLALLQGDPATARRSLDAVDALRAKVNWIPKTAWLTSSARLQVLAGDRDRARELLVESRRLREQADTRVAVLDSELRLLRLELGTVAAAAEARVPLERIEAELLRLNEPQYAIGAGLALVEAELASGAIDAAQARAERLGVAVQTRASRAQQLQLQWLLAHASTGEFRAQRLADLIEAAQGDGFHLLVRLAQRELLAENTPERTAIESALAADGLAGALQSASAAF